MKTIISNAKVVFSKAAEGVICRFQIASAVVAYTVAEIRLKKLHPVRNARQREEASYMVRSSRVAFELACKKLDTI